MFETGLEFRSLAMFYICAAAGLKSGQFNRKRNFEKENIEYRMSKELILSTKKKTERSDSILPHSTFRLPHSSNVVSYEGAEQKA
jgi:hypothetical protein